MCYSKSGYLWIAIKGRDLIRIETSSGTVTTAPIVTETICCSSEGSLYAITPDGMLFASMDGASDPECLTTEGGKAVPRK